MTVYEISRPSLYAKILSKCQFQFVWAVFILTANSASLAIDFIRGFYSQLKCSLWKQIDCFLNKHMLQSCNVDWSRPFIINCNSQDFLNLHLWLYDLSIGSSFWKNKPIVWLIFQDPTYYQSTRSLEKSYGNSGHHIHLLFLNFKETNWNLGIMWLYQVLGWWVIFNNIELWYIELS